MHQGNFGQLLLCLTFYLSMVEVILCSTESTGELGNSTNALDQVTPQPKTTTTMNLNPCMEDLGCFPLDGDFYHESLRSPYVPPYSREEIDVKFLINTEKSQKESYVLRALDVKNSTLKDIGINIDVETIFASHGFMDTPYNWIPGVREEFFKHGNYNFIAVDWTGGNQYPYDEAASNTRVVGAEIAFFVKNMQEKLGLDVNKVNIMGHSLGGQICGYAGKRIPGLGRITSFDPAEPEFQNLSTAVRIDPSDAKFVEVIHTDTRPFEGELEGLGMSQLAGHIDFFPNGGEEQPGCAEAQASGDAGVDVLVCNHMRCLTYFKESINSKCQMVGYACKDWETFAEGKCATCGTDGEKCAILGLRSIESARHKNDSQPLQLFLKTNNKSPFCLYHYQGLMNIVNSTSPGICGDLSVTVNGSLDSDSLIVKPSLNEENPSEKYYTFLFTTTKDLGELEKVTLDFKPENGTTSTTLPVNKLTLKPMFDIDQKKATAGTREFCLTNNDGLISGQSVTINASKTC